MVDVEGTFELIDPRLIVEIIGVDMF